MIKVSLLTILIYFLCGGLARSYDGAAVGAAGFASGCASGMAHRRADYGDQPTMSPSGHPCPIDGSETYFVRYRNVVGATELMQVRRCLLYNHESLWPGSDY